MDPMGNTFQRSCFGIPRLGFKFHPYFNKLPSWNGGTGPESRDRTFNNVQPTDFTAC